MPPFAFERAKAERSIRDPDGALWPVNIYSDADELNGLVQAAIESETITRPNRRAHLYIYPLSLSEPDPVLVYDPGHGRAFLGHSLKLRERDGESPIDFTMRFLEDLAAEANALAEGESMPPPPCTCSDVRGCPKCFDRAADLVGTTVRDGEGREWEVTGTDEKDGFPTLCGEDRWAYLADIEVVA
jgi:hypothetical protein